MAIHVDEANQVFHLQTEHTSYIFQVLAHGILGQIYYGQQIHVRPNYANLVKRELKNSTPAYSLDEPDFQLDAIKQEYAATGTGDLDGQPIRLVRAMAVELRIFSMIIMRSIKVNSDWQSYRLVLMTLMTVSKP